MGIMSIQPYRFQLAKLSSKQLQLEQALFSLLGSDDVSSVLQKSFEKFAQIHPHFHLETWRTETGTEAASKFSDQSISLVISLPNRKLPFVLELDFSTARQLIEHTLGGREMNEISGTALTEIEQGVLQYLVLQILAELNDASGGRKTLQLQRMLATREAAAFLPDDDLFVALTFRLHERGLNHFVRCLFPHRLLAEELAQQPISARPSFSKKELQNFQFIYTDLWAEAGETALSVSEIQQLEPGDVLLFDQSRVEWHAGKIQGEICLRVGLGEHGTLQGKLAESAPERLKVLLERQLGDEL